MKLTEMEWNWIIFTHLCFDKKIFWQIHSRDSHVKFTGKNKVGNTREQNYAVWFVKNDKTVFNKLMRKILCQFQVSKQAGKQALGLEFSLFRILDTFQHFKLF